MDVLGIDEAGRGSVLGPLVIAGVIVPEKMDIVLERMGVKDSKRLTPNRRTILSRKLKKMFEYDLVVISAQDIDNMRADGINLNEIERIGMEKILSNLNEEVTFFSLSISFSNSFSKSNFLFLSRFSL